MFMKWYGMVYSAAKTTRTWHGPTWHIFVLTNYVCRSFMGTDARADVYEDARLRDPHTDGRRGM